MFTAFSAQFHGSPAAHQANTLEYHGIPWNTMDLPEIHGAS